jgi:hypothetical protein
LRVANRFSEAVDLGGLFFDFGRAFGDGVRHFQDVLGEAE